MTRPFSLFSFVVQGQTIQLVRRKPKLFVLEIEDIVTKTESRPRAQDSTMASRPTVNVRSSTGGMFVVHNHDTTIQAFFAEASSSLPLPAVLTAPIRLDVVQQVHSA